MYVSDGETRHLLGNLHFEKETMSKLEAFLGSGTQICRAFSEYVEILSHVKVRGGVLFVDIPAPDFWTSPRSFWENFLSECTSSLREFHTNWCLYASNVFYLCIPINPFFLRKGYLFCVWRTPNAGVPSLRKGMIVSSLRFQNVMTHIENRLFIYIS